MKAFANLENVDWLLFDFQPKPAEGKSDSSIGLAMDSKLEEWRQLEVVLLQK
jgi:hypothetical protein